jgi:hypothetical protein
MPNERYTSKHYSNKLLAEALRSLLIKMPDVRSAIVAHTAKWFMTSKGRKTLQRRVNAGDN